MAITSTAPALRAQLFGLLRPHRAGVLYALVITVVVFQILTVAKGLPSYLAYANIRNVLDQGALDGFLVIGMTVLLITGNFDLSIGANAGFAAGVAVKVANGHGPWLAALAAIGVGVGVGAVNAVCVQVVGVNAFITTLGTLTALQGALLIFSNDQTILSNNEVFSSFGTGRWTLPQGVAIGIGIVLIVAGIAHGARQIRQRAPIVLDLGVAALGIVLVVFGTALQGLLTEARDVWVLLVLVVISALFMRYTVIGRRLYAVGGNYESARLSGVRVGSYVVSGFVASGVAAAVGGILYAGKYGSVDPTALSTEELPVIAAAILGGTSLFGGVGFITKSIVGVAILTVLANGFSVLNVGANYQYVVQGVVIIAAASVFTISSRRRRRASVSPPATPTTDQQPETTATPATVS